jgi:elongation factor 1-gamma
MSSQPGTPLFSGAAPENSRPPHSSASDQCVIDSSAYFIRTETPSISSTHPPHAREVLIFGDVEPDALSLSPRTAHVWAEAAPKIAAGILTGVFIECSYNNSQSDAVLYGHLAPRHLLAELQTLADMVRDARRELDRAAEEARKGRKRKRTSTSFLGIGDGGERERERKGRHFSGLGSSMALALEAGGSAYTSGDETITDAAPSPRFGSIGRTGMGRTAQHTGPATPVGGATTQPQHSALALKLEGKEEVPPLRGVKVVVIHVKDTLADGPTVGESILAELEEGERVLAEGGRGLGCQFVVSKGGGSYWF